MLTAISDTIRPMAATAPMPGLHGREAETGVLSRALDRAEGEAGIGKTRLLAQVAGAAGNPLFVTELLETIRQDGLLRTAGGRAEVTATSLPPTLGLTILRRLSFLAEKTLQALRSAAILGSAFSLRRYSRTTAPGCGSGMT